METRVSEVLQRKGHDVVTAAPTDTVLECIATMVKENVGSIVITEGDAIDGIFTERDYLRRIVLHGRTSRTTPVEDVMTREVLYVKPDHTIEHCLQVMTAQKCRHLPVVKDGVLDGIISIGDCVKQISHNAQMEVHNLRAYITGRYPA